MPLAKANVLVLVIVRLQGGYCGGGSAGREFVLESGRTPPPPPPLYHLHVAQSAAAGITPPGVVNRCSHARRSSSSVRRTTSSVSSVGLKRRLRICHYESIDRRIGPDISRDSKPALVGSATIAQPSLAIIRSSPDTRRHPGV